MKHIKDKHEYVNALQFTANINTVHDYHNPGILFYYVFTLNANVPNGIESTRIDTKTNSTLECTGCY